MGVGLQIIQTGLEAEEAEYEPIQETIEKTLLRDWSQSRRVGSNARIWEGSSCTASGNLPSILSNAISACWSWALAYFSRSCHSSTSSSFFIRSLHPSPSIFAIKLHNMGVLWEGYGLQVAWLLPPKLHKCAFSRVLVAYIISLYTLNYSKKSKANIKMETYPSSLLTLCSASSRFLLWSSNCLWPTHRPCSCSMIPNISLSLLNDFWIVWTQNMLVSNFCITESWLLKLVRHLIKQLLEHIIELAGAGKMKVGYRGKLLSFLQLTHILG